MSDPGSSDDDSGPDGGKAMLQCNLMGADLDEEEDPASSDANCLIPVGGLVDGGDEGDPQSLAAGS